MMSNTIAWITVALTAMISAVALSAACIWAVEEDNKEKAFFKTVLAALLFVAVIFLLGFLSTIVTL